MRIKSIIVAGMFLALLAGCGGSPFANRTTNPPVDVTQLEPMRVVSFNVTVPETLEVSEDNSYDPSADIVWRGDPFGSRYPQVKAIFETGIAAGVGDLAGSQPVILDIVVTRFHSQSEKIRYSFGGKYEVGYELRVRDADSNAVIVPNYHVYTEIDAPGGVEALAADQAGRTEKLDNINLIARSIYMQLTGMELTAPALAVPVVTTPAVPDPAEG